MTTVVKGSGIGLAGTETNQQVINAAIQQLQQGRSNAVVEVTLTANTASTTVTATNCAAGCAPVPVAMTANAAAELGNGTMYVGTISNGSFVITHANNAQTDRTFRFVTIG